MPQTPTNLYLVLGGADCRAGNVYGRAGWVRMGAFGRAEVKTLNPETGVRADGSVCSLPADLEGLKALLWF